MQEHEYRARDKTVKKMSRDGLKEENLHSRKSIRVSNRETDDFFCPFSSDIGLHLLFFSAMACPCSSFCIFPRPGCEKEAVFGKSRQNRSCGNSRAGHGEKWKKTGGFQKNADTGIGECQMAGRNRGSRQQYRGTFV
ncbi:MAG: hypothetical protein BHV91_07175 [Clostridiales bacterium 44_9]|nr:MAG: hypothetical protein BHV91_07175 [Clostridiales bacterium 44_9]